MLTLDNAWIDSKIRAVASVLGTFRSECDGFHFEPTTQFYEALNSDSETGLKDAAVEIALHLGLPAIPPVDFDWGIKMEPQYAGQVRLDHSEARIRIPFRFAGRAYALGAILAHEMCHVFMMVRCICAAVDEEYEPLTDLTTVCAGLGKLSLNGTIPDSDEIPMMQLQLGYLPHDMLVYAFSKVNRLKGIRKDSATVNLRPEVRI